VPLSSAKSAKLRNVLVGHAVPLERARQLVLIELRVGARPRHGSHIGEGGDADGLQQAQEFIERPRGMPDGEKTGLRGHVSLKRNALRLAPHRTETTDQGAAT